jgi:hypothetical protein
LYSLMLLYKYFLFGNNEDQFIVWLDAWIEFKDQFNYVMLFAFGSSGITQQQRVVFTL